MDQKPSSTKPISKFLLKAVIFTFSGLIVGILLGEWTYQTYIEQAVIVENTVKDEIKDSPQVGIIKATKQETLSLKSKKKSYDKTLWQKNASHPGLISNKPKIVLVIDDMGLNYEKTKKISNLDVPLTLAFLPYVNRVKEQVELAQEKGHEILVHVPMEPLSETEDPGPNVLKLSLNNHEFLERLKWDLEQFEGYVGINNHMGSRLTANRPAMKMVMKTLREKGLIFLDSKTTEASVANDVAEEFHVPNLARDVFIDHETTFAHIYGQLEKIENIAKRQGYVVAIGHPGNNTLTALEEWIPTLEAKGLQIVPLTSIILLKQNDDL